MMRVLVLLAGLAVAPAALAQTAYPTKPIRIVVPFTPGGGVDLLARIVGGKLTEAWGQPTVIDHRPGASATLGPALVAKSQPDGYTLVLVTTGFTMTPGLQKVPYDPVRDFTPLTLIAVVPNVLAVHPSLPAKSLKDLVALSRSQPLTYASSGYAAVGHLVMEMLRISVPGLQLAHVPYKGNSQALTGVLTGEVAIAPTALPSAMTHISSGRLRAIAVTTARRAPSAPQVPTLAESGAPGYEYASEFGLLLPARTPADVVAKLHAEISRALKTPDMIEKLNAQGYDIVALGPDEYAASIRANLAKWAKVIRTANIRAE
ncbi:MAG TPA: tripartite tricarboxylate transporter substrate binding protein [Burkholderiales bacterium]|nr:tripartite tricarboxylate transporter substrate binding protein [Burkholderiales bacterium]